MKYRTVYVFALCDCATVGRMQGGETTLRLRIPAGAEVDISLGRKVVLAPTVRFTRGISTISNAPGAPDAVNSAVQLGVGFRWRL